MIGTNNLDNGDSAADIKAGIKANLDEYRRALPDSKIVVMGVLPRGVAGDPRRQTIAATNAIVLNQGSLVDNRCPMPVTGGWRRRIIKTW